MLAALMKPASGSDPQHEDSTSLIDPWEALKNLGMTLACTVTQFQGVTNLIVYFVESNNSNSQIFREFFAIRCHVEHLVVSMREWYSKHKF